MKNLKFKISVFIVFLMLVSFHSCKEVEQEEITGNLKIGWASVDITPDRPVLISGQNNARISEGVMDPVIATALAIESGNGAASEKIIMIGCDLSQIRMETYPLHNKPPESGDLWSNVRKLLTKSIPEVDPERIVLNATHTHSGPYYSSEPNSKEMYGIELDNVMSPLECLDFLSGRLAKAAEQAWKDRKPGGISYGFDHAVIGQGRLNVDLSGRTTLYAETNNDQFSHLEGYEDNSVNLLYTWNDKQQLSGIVINVAVPSQNSESIWEISADFWHDTRNEIHQRLGDNIFVLPQCGAGGERSPHLMVDKKAEERMQKIMFPGDKSGRSSIGRRKQIAKRIADAVTNVLPYMKDKIEWSPVVKHKMEILEITRRPQKIEDVKEGLEQSARYKEQYEKLLDEIEKNPEIKKKPRWYADVSRNYRMLMRGQIAARRSELQKIQPTMPTEVHVIRISDIVIATNQFELFSEYAMRIKARSPAVQTFVVQLSGQGGYLPTAQSLSGKGYGAVGNLVGPEGGQELVEGTLKMINKIWD